MMVNLELYKIFYIVAKTGNITKASAELNISQPAVTKHIKNLESQLETPLFRRTKKGVVLNEYGEKLFLKVKNAMALIHDAEQEINEYNLSDKGTIKIGISTSLAGKFLLKNLKEFNKMHPNISIEIYTDPTQTLIKQIKNGQIDMIIGKFPWNKDYDLEYTKLGKTKYIFVVNEDYLELTKKEIFVDDLIKYPLLLQRAPSNSRDSADKYFKDNHVNVQPKMNIGSSSLLVNFVSLGYGIGYVTKLYVEEELKNKTLYELKVNSNTNDIEYGIILLKNNVMTSYCKKFIDFLIDSH